MLRAEVLPNQVQHGLGVALSRQRDVKATHLELEQTRQQLCVLHICTMRRIEIAARARVYANALALLW